MSNKLRRDFLVAVNNDWYQALTERSAKKARNKGKEVIQIPAPMKDGRILSAGDFYNLTHMAVNESKGVRQELARTLASHLVRNPEKMIWLVSVNEHQEQSKRYFSLSFDADLELYNEQGEKLDNHLKELGFLRDLPARYYNESLEPATVPKIEYLARKTDLARSISKKLRDYSPDKSEEKKIEEIMALLMQEDSLSADDLVRWADDCGFHYGDPPDDYDGPRKDEMQVYFNIASAVTRHWDEFRNGNYDALCVRKKSPDGKVFIRKPFIEKKLCEAKTLCPQ